VLKVAAKEVKDWLELDLFAELQWADHPVVVVGLCMHPTLLAHSLSDL
jgi:hypothetical protein